MKKNNININKLRSELPLQYLDNDYKILKTINAIAIKSSLNPDAIFSDLMRIIENEGTLYQAIGNISKKEGALTPGTELDNRTVDATSTKLVTELIGQLKSNQFRFKPIRRVYMDKSGKQPVTKEQFDNLKKLHNSGKISMDQIKQLKARPLGISSFPDKIIQEALRMVLNAIYEPLFARFNVNFGFRPKYGCTDAIIAIKKAKQMDFAIEGDIKGAFDNVNHDILIQILEKKIDDKRFLKLIKSGLKCGVIFLNFRQDSDLGTTQGSVVSPLLYNIYFHEFDKYMCNEFKLEIEMINQKENRKDRPINKLYNSYSKKKTKIKLKDAIETAKNSFKEEGNSERTKQLYNSLNKKIMKYKELDTLQKKLPAFAKSRQTIRYAYIRYADDWIFLTNATLERTEEWKVQFTDIIKEKLNLTVSEEKTKITNLKDKGIARFLGFQLTRAGNKRIKQIGVFKTQSTDLARRSKIIKVTIPENNKLKYKIRTTNPELIAAFDRERVLPRLIQSGFIRKLGNSWRGRSKLPWTTLPEPEIIERFNYMIRGYVNYYVPVIDYPTDIQFLHYLLTYSCLHTIAQKKNTSLRKIIRKYGKNVEINYKTKTISKGVETEIEKNIKLLNWSDVLDIARKAIQNTRKKQKSKESISIIEKTVDDICNVKINWRTKYKLKKYCAICGSTDSVEYHHVKHIKIGKITGFLQVMKQLNRRQIPCCKKCHNNIHKGAYDGMALKDLYDETLIILEKIK